MRLGISSISENEAVKGESSKQLKDTSRLPVSIVLPFQTVVVQARPGKIDFRTQPPCGAGDDSSCDDEHDGDDADRYDKKVDGEN